MVLKRFELNTVYLLVMAITLSGCVFDTAGLSPPNHNNNSGMTDAEIQPDTSVNNNNDACVPTNGGVEICDEVDNNCNGQVDEGFDLLSDPQNCGSCGNVCSYFHAMGQCIDGDCQMVACGAGWVDLNQDSDDGCEYQCSVTNGGVEICDGADNDCDGQIDEVFDLQNDTNNCGYCGNFCNLPNATSQCVAGQCEIVECSKSGTSHTWWDQNSNPTDGCEYQCQVTMGGHEVCDGLDNNCDGQIDEDCGSLKLLFQFGDAWTTWPTYVADLSGNGNNGVAYGGASLACNAGDFVPGEDQDSCSAQFNGVDGYIEVADSASLDSIATGFTIMMWVKPLVLGTNDYLIWKQDDQPSIQMWNQGSYYNWVLATGSGQSVSTTTQIQVNTWTHITMTYSNGNLSAYIDGILDSFAAVSFSPGGIIKIGTDGVAGRYFNGHIDEIAIYNMGWSQADIQKYLGM